MRVCTRCGNLATGQQRYCTRCVAPLDPPGVPPGPPPEPPEPPGTALLIAQPRPVALRPPHGAWNPALPGYGPPGYGPAGAGADDLGDDLFAGGEAATSALPPLVIDDRPGGGYADGPDGPAGPRHRAGRGHRRPRGTGAAGVSGAGGVSGGGASGGLLYPPADPREASEGRRAQIASAVLGAVLVVAGFLTAWAAVSREGGLDGSGTRLSSSQQSAPRAQAPHRAPAATRPSGPAAGTPASPEGTTPPGGTGAGGTAVVTLAPGTGQSPLAAPVHALLVGYFTAINQHRFSRYAALFLPAVRHQLSRASFAAGYASTTDNGIVLVALTTGPRSAAATVTFISRQQPAAGAATCTDWDITLFLARHGTGYLIGAPPPGYHAYQHACR